MPVPEHRLGIDVGGTNTDAVIMDPADRIVAKAKVPCTPDITGGITRAIDTVLHAPGADPRRISHVMLGTTHATNAVLERRNLRRVAVIRIGGPATHSVRPMFGWPRDLDRHDLGRGDDRGRRRRVRRPGPVPAGHRRHRALSRRGRRRRPRAS